MIDCEALVKNYLTFAEAEFQCEQKGDYLVLATPFTYYDGDQVQVFVRPLSDGTVEISDLGHAIRKLNAAGIEISKAATRESFLDAIRRSRGIDFDRGRLFTACPEIDFAEGMTRLVQAMLQTDDLAFSRKPPAFRSFTSDVEDVLKVAHVGYRRAVRLQGAYGVRTHEFDFQLELPGLTVVKALSAVSNFGADDQANRLLGAIVDLRPTSQGFTPIIFLDDTESVSWRYAEGILRAVSADVYRFKQDKESYFARLEALRRTA